MLLSSFSKRKSCRKSLHLRVISKTNLRNPFLIIACNLPVLYEAKGVGRGPAPAA